MIIGGRATPSAQARPEDNYSDLEFMRGFLGLTGEQMQSGITSQQAGNQRGGMASPSMPGRGALGTYGQGPAKTSPLSARGMGSPVQPAGGRVSPEVMTPAHDKDFWNWIGRNILGGGGGGGAPAAPAVSPEVTQAQEQVMMRALQGQGAFAPSVYEAQYGQARAGIAAQAARQREQMMGQLAQRGMMRSGVAAEGVQGLQQAQMQAQAGVATQMAAQRMQQQQQASMAAMGMYPQMQQVGVQQQYAAMARRQAAEERQRYWINLVGQLAGVLGQGTPAALTTPQAPAMSGGPVYGYLGAGGAPISGGWGTGMTPPTTGLGPLYGGL